MREIKLILFDFNIWIDDAIRYHKTDRWALSWVAFRLNQYMKSEPIHDMNVGSSDTGRFLVSWMNCIFFVHIFFPNLQMYLYIYINLDDNVRTSCILWGILLSLENHWIRMITAVSIIVLPLLIRIVLFIRDQILELTIR